MSKLFKSRLPRLRSKLARAVKHYVHYPGFLERVFSDPDPRVRANGVESLAAVDTPKAVALLQRAVEDPDTRVRTTALVGLHRHEPATAAEALIRQAKESAVERRLSAAWAMGEIAHPIFQEDLERLAADADEAVVNRARMSLLRLATAAANPVQPAAAASKVEPAAAASTVEIDAPVPEESAAGIQA